MKRFLSLVLFNALFWTAAPRRVEAQLAVIDDVILLTSRQKQKEEARIHRHLKPPGGEDFLLPSPGADEPRLGEEPVRAAVLRRVLSTDGRRHGRPDKGRRLLTPVALEPPREEVPLVGPLDLPTEDEGPPDGLSLEDAIERLVGGNTELAARFQDIPKARADVLTAGLRNNPFLFVSVSNIPYGSYSPARPGATSYDLTIIQPIDLNGKRQARVRVAEQAKLVLEAEYQDSVRQEIARLCDVYTNVLAARESSRALRAGLDRLASLADTARDLTTRGLQPPSDVAQLTIHRANAEIAVQQAETILVQARRALAALLAIPAEQADALVLRGSLHDRAPQPPCTEALIRTALETRPDLAAYRLGTGRAIADLHNERAEALDNAFLFYTPLAASDFTPQRKQSAAGWGVGVLLPVPLFDRNQGDIARARANVSQTQLERQDLERRIAHEVRFAAAEYDVSCRAVQEYEREILTDARNLREEVYRRYTRGQESLRAILEIQEEYNDLVREYLDILLRHRRDMLRLNAVVGQRILP